MFPDVGQIAVAGHKIVGIAERSGRQEKVVLRIAKHSRHRIGRSRKNYRHASQHMNEIVYVSFGDAVSEIRLSVPKPMQFIEHLLWHEQGVFAHDRGANDSAYSSARAAPHQEPADENVGIDENAHA
jgi:hypothetical protein